MDAKGLAKLLRKPLAELPRELELVPVPGPFDVVVTPPGSKSITNRALLLAALAKGESELRGALLDADDAQVMMAALRRLGAEVEIGGSGEVRIVGRAGRFKGGCALNLNNAGTATRFLTAAACLADAPVTIDGNARMRQRPIGELVELLRALGVRIDELGAPGCLPLRVHPGKFEKDRITVETTHSSQFVSALMLVAPWMPKGLTIQFQGAITSPSYLFMTSGMLSALLCRGFAYAPRCSEGLREARFAGVPGDKSIELRHCPDTQWTCDFAVEPDASGATYFWAAAALVNNALVATPGIGWNSLQGDARFPTLLREMGAGAVESAGLPKGHVSPEIAQHPGGNGWVVRGAARQSAIEADLTLMPDAAMTLAAVACFAEGPTTIKGLRTLRVKETDRLAAVKNELSKIGVGVEIFSYTRDDGSADEGLRITPPKGGVDCSARVARVEFETYDDHRMAMSLALIGLRRPNVVIRDPQCVAKTYPTFWRDWAKLYESAAGG